MERIALFIVLLMLSFPSRALDDAALLARIKSYAFPLYGERVDAASQERSACIGFDIALNPQRDLVAFLTAGHCHNAYFPRDERGERREVVLVGRVYDGVVFDFLFAFRSLCAGESSDPPSVVPLRVGERYYSLGQVREVDAIAHPELIPLASDDFARFGLVAMELVSLDDRGPRFSERCPDDGCIFRMTPGVSGAPIVDREGHVAALYVGYGGLSLSSLRGVSLEHVVPMVRSAALFSERDGTRGRGCPIERGVRK